MLGADATTSLPRPADDPLSPPRVPVDRALLDLIHRGDLWCLLSDHLRARDLAVRQEDYQAGLDAHRGGSPTVLPDGPSHAELQRRRREYRGLDGEPARAKTGAQVMAEAASSARRWEREIPAEPLPPWGPAWMYPAERRAG